MAGTRKEIELMEEILDVPYYSQYRDISDRDRCLVACGITCAYMALVYYKPSDINLEDFVKKGIESGGYGRSGWYHDYLVSLFSGNGISCGREEGMKDEGLSQILLSLKNGNPVIVSAQRRIFDRRTFHMVVLVGYREDKQGKLEGFFYHDSAALRVEDGKTLFVPKDTFLLDWRRMAIFPKGRGANR